MAETDEENKIRYREVSFGRTDVIKQFEGTFLAHGNLVSRNIEKSRMSWLQNCIVWEPVDGQHIVAACHLAKEDFPQGRMSAEVYNRSYAKHKARVIMFNQPQLYIEASVRINAKEFERDFYTTMYEDMVSLCAIWVSCRKPNPEIRVDDVRRKDAVTMAASALHMTVSCVGGPSHSETCTSGCRNTHDMYGMSMRHATKQPCKFAMTMRTIRFGLVRGTASSGYNMHESTSWILTLIHGHVRGGWSSCG